MSATVANDNRARPNVLGSSTTDMIPRYDLRIRTPVRAHEFQIPNCPFQIPSARLRRHRTRHTGHDVVADSRALERERFFAAASEDEGIAALQSNDALAAPGSADHQRFDRALRHRVAARALSDEESLRAARISEDAA